MFVCLLNNICLSTDCHECESVKNIGVSTKNFKIFCRDRREEFAEGSLKKYLLRDFSSDCCTVLQHLMNRNALFVIVLVCLSAIILFPGERGMIPFCDISFFFSFNKYVHT